MLMMRRGLGGESGYLKSERVNFCKVTFFLFPNKLLFNKFLFLKFLLLK